MIRAAVLGSPLSHSLSPLLHTVAYNELGLKGDYTAIEVKSGELSDFLLSCDESWTGFSLTMPLKEEVIALADVVSPLALTINSANTLIRESGQWHATTTDVSGFTHALSSAGIHISGEVLIIGAGATARAAAAACDGVANSITVMSRSVSREKDMREAVKTSQIDFISWGDSSSFSSAQLIISTTPSGASDSLSDFLPKNPNSSLFDALYHPWPTLILERWKDNGGEIIDGLDLLIHQAIDQMQLFARVTFDRQDMAKLLRKHGLIALNSST